MSANIMDKVEQAFIKKNLPEFKVGDTVSVSVRIVEGQKERTQVFTGTVVSRKGRGANEMFTVRRIVANEGVERIFPLNSPQVLDVKVLRSGHVRRAKLYYLRERIGKSVRLREQQHGMAGDSTDAAEVPDETLEPQAEKSEAAKASS